MADNDQFQADDCRCTMKLYTDMLMRCVYSLEARLSREQRDLSDVARTYVHNTATRSRLLSASFDTVTTLQAKRGRTEQRRAKKSGNRKCRQEIGRLARDFGRGVRADEVLFERKFLVLDHQLFAYAKGERNVFTSTCINVSECLYVTGRVDKK